jgi:hypothetical protein
VSRIGHEFSHSDYTNRYIREPYSSGPPFRSLGGGSAWPPRPRARSVPGPKSPRTTSRARCDASGGCESATREQNEVTVIPAAGEERLGGVCF